MVPAGLACIAQYLVLFADDFAGTSSSMTLRVLLGAELVYVIIMYLRGLLLPIFSITSQGRHEEQKDHIMLVALCNAIAIVEACLLTETGFRANDGNFDWAALALYPCLFAISIALLFRMIQTGDRSNKRDLAKIIVGLVLLLGHLVVGVYCLHQPGNAGFDWFYF